MEELTRKKIDEISNSLFKIAFSLFLLFLSTTFVTAGQNFRTTLVLFPQTAVYGVFALLHAFAYLCEKEAFYHNSSPLDFIASTIQFWAFYTVILLPLSGLGLLQWLITFFVLSANLVSSSFALNKVTERFSGLTTLDFTVFGIFMFCIKIGIFYFLPDNLYDEFITGNTVIRYVIAGISTVFLLAGIIALIRQFVLNAFCEDKRANQKKVSKNQKKSFVKSLGRFLVRTGKKVTKTVAVLFTGGQILILFFILILVSGGLCLFLVKGFLDGILAFIEPFLKRLLTSGEYFIPKNQLYGLFQSGALILSLFVQLWKERQGKAAMEKMNQNLMPERS